MFTQLAPSNTRKPFSGIQLVQYTTNPSAGVAIKFICDAVIRGGRKPLVVVLKSNCALAFGVIVPIPTLPSALMTILSDAAKLLVEVVANLI